VINGSDLINNPWTTVLSPFTDLLGSGFYLFLVSIITAALYMKTRDPVMVSSFMILIGALLSTGGIWTGLIQASILYIIFTALGITGLVLSILFRRR